MVKQFYSAFNHLQKSICQNLLCRNSGPSSPGGKSAPVSEVDGEDALPPLGEDDAAVEDDPAGIADVVVEVEMDATGCR